MTVASGGRKDGSRMMQEPKSPVRQSWQFPFSYGMSIHGLV